MNIRDSVCVLGGVLLGCGISYKLFRVQSAQLKQLQALDAHIKRMEEKQYQDAKQTSLIADKLEEHTKYEKTVTDKLEVIQTHQNELGKAETDDKKALERKFEEIMTSLKKEGANIHERSRKLNIHYNASLESQLKLLKEKCDSLEQFMKDEVYKISLKIDSLTEETPRIGRKIESSTHEEIPVEGQDDIEEDRPIGPLDVEEDRALDIFRYDILLLHGKKDQNEATKCKTFLMNNFTNISNLQVALPEDLFEPGSQLLPGLSSILDSCRLVFIYQTKSLDSDTVAGYGKDINVIQSLEDPQKAKRIIPLQVNEEKISVELSPIIHLKYVNDTNHRQFPTFKEKFEKLVDSWRKTLR
ncbi:uncharacterized protein LOC134687931 [Mytilus trossulus]|uniref:uncharacterized protein LOC134687931 n=1 Tax=Mytilus trossulus TaxID=6551 RepID=UPI00300705EB